MHPQTNYPFPTRPAGAGASGFHQPRQPDGGRKQIVLNVLSILIALYTVYEVLGISNFFALKGMTNDDAEMVREDMIAKTMFDPVGFVCLIALLAAVIIIHGMSKKMPWFLDTMTKVGLVITATAFVLSLVRVSIVFPMLFIGLGMFAIEVQNGSDVRTPAEGEFALEAAELIQYGDASGVRVASSLTNSSTDLWQTATVAITYTDMAGTPCGTYEQVEEYIAPGQQRSMMTKFLTAAVYYDDPSCVPVTSTAELVRIDVDSRTEIPQTDYERIVPAFDSLALFEDPWIDGSVVKLSVTGTVSPASMGAMQEAPTPPIGFEVMDRQGPRLSWCFEPEELAPDGRFMTGNFHSPVTPGEFPTLVVVPEGC